MPKRKAEPPIESDDSDSDAQCQCPICRSEEDMNDCSPPEPKNKSRTDLIVKKGKPSKTNTSVKSKRKVPREKRPNSGDLKIMPKNSRPAGKQEKSSPTQGFSDSDDNSIDESKLESELSEETIQNNTNQYALKRPPKK